MEDNEGEAKLLRRVIKRIAKTKFAQRETDRISGGLSYNIQTEELPW